VGLEMGNLRAAKGAYLERIYATRTRGAINKIYLIIDRLQKGNMAKIE
jgi:hypothetical protein